MGKVYSNKICSKCHSLGTVIESWGVFYCKECYAAKPKRANGNSGMIFKGVDINDYKNNVIGLSLERCKKSHPVFCDMFLTHYPGSKGIMGRTLNYLIRLDGDIVGIIGANSPPLNYKLFRKFFDTENENLFLNNNVFKLIIHKQNLGTRILKMFRQRIFIDYTTEYNNLLGLCTFVEPPRTGAIYKADNWLYLGETQGMKVVKRNMNLWQNKEWLKGTKKLIFAIKL